MGYVHDTTCVQIIPCTLFHVSTATITQTAGEVASTIALNRAAANQTSIVTVPITIPSSTVALKGAMLTKVEIDYENLTAEATSHTFVLNKVTRGANGAAATVAAVTCTQSIAAADSHTVAQVRQVLTITTPTWTDDDEYYLLVDTIVAGGGGAVNKFLSAAAYYTLRY